MHPRSISSGAVFDEQLFLAIRCLILILILMPFPGPPMISCSISSPPSRTKNEEHAMGNTKAGIPVDLASAPGGGGGVAKRGKTNTRGALEMVQRSTASMGK